MGVDFYVYTDLVIVFKDEKQAQDYVNIGRSGAYFWDYDRDEETWEEAKKRQMTERSKSKLVFSDGKWISKNHDEYIAHLKNVNLTTVSTITKKVYCVLR
jgi:hypothetical protein